jgi:hypothetical protein
MWALTLHPPERDQPFAEPQRIESDPEYRALFLAGPDAAITERSAEHVTELDAFVDGVEAAADRLPNLVGTDNGERAA